MEELLWSLALNALEQPLVLVIGGIIGQAVWLYNVWVKKAAKHFDLEDEAKLIQIEDARRDRLKDAGVRAVKAAIQSGERDPGRLITLVFGYWHQHYQETTEVAGPTRDFAEAIVRGELQDRASHISDGVASTLVDDLRRRMAEVAR